MALSYLPIFIPNWFPYLEYWDNRAYLSHAWVLNLTAQRQAWLTETVASADVLGTTELGFGPMRLGIPAAASRSSSNTAPRQLTPRDRCLPQRRLLLIVLCSVGFSAVYILLCYWACLPFCSAFCLDPHLSLKSRPTVPGPLHFSGYSSVPDGKVSLLGSMSGGGE